MAAILAQKTSIAADFKEIFAFATGETPVDSLYGFNSAPVLASVTVNFSWW